MSGIYIKGMRKPDCGLTVTIYPDGRVVQFLGYGEKKQLGTAIPVPEHGRLVDADALIEHLGDVEYKGAVKRVLIQATTIIEGDATDAERAKWVYDTEPDMFRCSKCNGFAPRNDYPFCHWCGAKMEVNG